MDEHIKREAALKTLRGSAIAKYPASFVLGLLAAADEISRLPYVDVVRCVDCEHLYFKDMSAYCPYTLGPRRPDGFCSDGKRRAEG